MGDKMLLTLTSMDKKKESSTPPIEKVEKDLKIETKKKFKGHLMDVLKKPVRKKD